MKSIRTRILETAHWHFMKFGYDKTSTRDIARELEITQPALYHYFKNKEALYFEVLQTFATEIGKDLKTIVAHDSFDLHSHLKTMSLFIQEKHPMNFNMLIHDMNAIKSQTLRTELYLVWKENYFQPFFDLFQMHTERIRDDLHTDQIVLQFLRVLSVYITSNPTQSDHENLSGMIDIFVRGISLN